MDYNFIVAQSGGRTDLRRAEAFKGQMLATYLAYFRASHTGNRAPLHIGHHFEAYQGGVYNEALKEFARRVDGLPEGEMRGLQRARGFHRPAESGRARRLPAGRLRARRAGDHHRGGDAP